MPIPLESIQVGQCYLTNHGQVRRVIGLVPGRVQFERRTRSASSETGWAWVSGLAERRAFALLVEREVPCDWTREGEG